MTKRVLTFLTLLSVILFVSCEHEFVITSDQLIDITIHDAELDTIDHLPAISFNQAEGYNIDIRLKRSYPVDTPILITLDSGRLKTLPVTVDSGQGQSTLELMHRVNPIQLVLLPPDTVASGLVIRFAVTIDGVIREQRIKYVE